MDQVEGTFTFVFTDIEGSTRLLQALGDAYPTVLAEHDDIVRAAAASHGGRAFGSEGDAQYLVFGTVDEAIAAAVEAQRRLAAHAWGDRPLRVRMGIHSGRARPAGDGFTGIALHATARITAAGHGGQVLVSDASHALSDRLPEGVSFRDLGEHRLKDFDEPVRIHQLDIEGLAVTFPALRTRPAVMAHLPTQLTDFVGRAEVAAVRDALASSRIVTLTGPGGTGKTRLAIQVASEVAPGYPDGTYFVALDGVRDAALVASEIAMTLGLMSGAEAPLERLVTYLAERAVLLVLDNVEQVVDAGPDVARLVRESPGLHVLATSRIPLSIYGEREFPVPALKVPPAGASVGAATLDGYEAARLFVARAAAARPGFSVDDASAPLVADIVRRLDGLPLAIELAAARLRSLPLTAMRDRLADRLDLLTGGGRDRPARQQTLRGAIEWSHGLLDEPDQRLFARLGIMAGAVGLEVIEEVCGPAQELERDVFEGLDSLSRQSLVRTLDDGADELRFTMLGTIREYAVERLQARGERATLERRHAQAFLRLAESAEPHLLGPDGRAWNGRLERCHDDLRSALDWAVREDEGEIGLRFIAALWRFWQVRGHLLEGEVRAHAVLGLASVAGQSSDLLARAEAAAGGISYWRSDNPATRYHYLRALEHARASGDRALIAASLYDLGFAAADDDIKGLQRYLKGEPYFEEALAIHRELGDRSGEASDLWALHQAAGARGDAEASERLGRETLEISRRLNDPFRTGWAAYTLAIDIVGPGLERLDEAMALLRESLELFIAGGDRSGILLNTMTIALAALRAGDTDAGWRLIGAGRRVNVDLGVDLLDESFALGMETAPRDPETPEERRLFDEGWQMDEAEAVELALQLAARLARLEGAGAAREPHAGLS